MNNKKTLKIAKKWIKLSKKIVKSWTNYQKRKKKDPYKFENGDIFVDK